MKLELKPEALEVVKKDDTDFTNAGISKDGQFSWTYVEGLLEVTLPQTNEVLSSWRFGKAIKDLHTSISCVTDLIFPGGHLLLVATSNLSDQGTLNIYSIGLRKVIRAIEIPQKITALEMVFANTNEDVPSWIISKHLQFFSGLAAVGTEAGYIYLVDLCLDDLAINHSTEAMPKKLSIVRPHIVDPKVKREQARSCDRHIALLVDDQCHKEGLFYLRRQDDTVQKVLNEDSVSVTSLKYLSQAGILAVGFNFGSFQLWRLYNPVLDYCSRYSPDGTAITDFVVQEPENDPRNFVYMWVIHDDEQDTSLSSICLYQLSFAKKDVYANFGFFYDELESVCARLDHKLTLDPYDSNSKSTRCSNVIGCYTITNPFYMPPATLTDSFEEGLHSKDLSLSVFVWHAEGKQGGGSGKFWMCIFDLNRWYHAQMPHALRCHGSSLQVCPYWAVYSLDDVLSLSASFNLLNVEIVGGKVLRFINNSPLPPEEHSFPSALQITNVRFVMADAVIKGRCDGWQGHLLQELVNDGAQILVQPNDFYYQCLRARLLPHNYEDVKTKNVSYQRLMLLNMALEHGLTSTLVTQCIQQWADGEYAEQGCTLNLLLDWSWDRVINIKHSWDTACKMLYDWSCHHLDPRTDWQLASLSESLFHLKLVFFALAAQSGPTTERGQIELELRQDVVSILLQHTDVVRWCVSFNVLPEIDETSDPMPGLFAYPISDLCEKYKKRRAELKSLKGAIDGFSLLLIDEFIECQGPDIKKVWETLGGDGFYPPPSVQALVNMYLVEEVNIDIKHAITLYLLQDLAALSKVDGEETLVASFIQRFMLSPSLVHQVQGLWFIDHRDFEEGVRQLVNPNIHDDLGCSWKHAAVVNTLLAQSEGKAATRYLHTKGVLGGSPQEQQLYISVLINNRHISQAVEYMRGCQNESNAGRLTTHLLKECQKYKLLGHLLQLNLTDSEERYLESYLRGQAEPHALEPLLLYYLHHSHFLRAFQLNEDMKRMDKLETSHIAQDRAAARNRLMEAYLKALPDVTRKLLMEKQKGSMSAAARHFQVHKPKPLSTVVHRSDHVAMSRSHFVMSVLEKVKEAEQVIEKEEEEDDEEKGSAQDSVMLNQTNVPFLSTPRTPKHQSHFRTTEVIYPELKISPRSTNPLSATKHKSLSNYAQGQVNVSMSLRQLTEECLQLLRTPVTDHKRKPTSFGVNVKTPQSILKVRRLSKTLLPGSRDKSSARRTSGSRAKRLGFSKSDSTLLASSSSPPSAEITEISPSPHSLTVSTTAVTPKQIRFVGISPSPSTIDIDISRSFTEKSEELSEQLETSVSPSSKVSLAEPIGVKLASENTPVTAQKGSEELPDATLMPEDNPVSESHMHTHVTESSHTELPFVLRANGSYSSQLKELTRPDLQSAWKDDRLHLKADYKQNATAELIIDDDITFNFPQAENDVHPIPSMTSSPIDMSADIPGIFVTQKDSLMDAAKSSNESHVSTSGHITQKVSSSHLSEKHIVSFSQEIVKTSRKQLELSVNTETSSLKEVSPIRALRSRDSLSPVIKTFNQRHSSSVSPKSKPKAAGNIANDRNETKSRNDESPPATPPSSKKAKMMFSAMQALESLRREQRFSPPLNTEEEIGKALDRQSPSRSLRKTPNRQSPSRNLQKTSERQSPSRNLRKTPERQSPSRSLRKSPERQSPSRTIRKRENDTAAEETSESSAPKRLRRTPERQSPARQSVSRKHMELSATENSSKEMKTQSLASSAPGHHRKIHVEVSEKENPKLEADTQAEAVVSSSPSRRNHRAVDKINTEEDGEKASETVTTAHETGKLDISSSLEVPVRRRSARLNTPDRVLGEVSVLEPFSPARGRGKRAKTPQQVTGKESTDEVTDRLPVNQSAKPVTLPSILEHAEAENEKKSSPDKPSRNVRSKFSKSRATEKQQTEGEEMTNLLEVPNLRRSRRQSKTPERLIAGDTIEPVSPIRRSKRHPRSPEKLNIFELEGVAVKASSVSPLRSSQEREASKKQETPRKSSTSMSPEPPLTPTRRSARKPRSLDQLNTDEIEPVSPNVSPTRLQAEKVESNVNEDTSVKQVNVTSVPPASPTTTKKRGKLEEMKTPVHSLRDRKTPDRKMQGKESNEAETNELREESSKAEMVSLKTSRKSPSRQTKSPARKGRRAEMEHTSEAVENTDADEEWREEMPPLRLEVEEEEERNKDDSDFTKTKQVQKQRQTPDRVLKNLSESRMASEDPLPPVTPATMAKSVRKRIRKEDVSKELSPSFVFSPPLKQTGHGQRGMADDEEVPVQRHVFIFSNPTVAVDDEEGKHVTEAKTESKTQGQAEVKKSKKKRILYHESPILLTPGSPVTTRRLGKQPTENQRASASIVKRYKPRAPRARRIKPSSWTEPTTSRQ